MGVCGGANAAGPGFGRGHGFGMGMGRGFGRGFGRGRGSGMGWAAVGYTPGGDQANASIMREAFEERRAFLRAELARTEALLAGNPANPDARGNGVKQT